MSISALSTTKTVLALKLRRLYSVIQIMVIFPISQQHNTVTPIIIGPSRVFFMPFLKCSTLSVFLVCFAWFLGLFYYYYYFDLGFLRHCKLHFYAFYFYVYSKHAKCRDSQHCRNRTHTHTLSPMFFSLKILSFALFVYFASNASKLCKHALHQLIKLILVEELHRTKAKFIS